MASLAPRDGLRLPAPPSPRTLMIRDDDPLEPVAIYHHRAPPPPEVETTGCGRLIGIAVGSLLALILTTAMVGPGGFVPAGLLLLGYGLWRVKSEPAVKFDAFRRLEDRPRPLPAASPSGRPVRPLGPMHTADQAVIELKHPEGTPGAGFDPSDPRHRAVADLIHTCRARDGLGFTGPPSAAAPRALVASIEPFGASGATLEERLDQWARVARFIEAHRNPQAVWLAALAGREGTSARRGAAALEALGAMPDQRGQLDRVMASIDAEGHWCARGAVAITRADAEAMDRLIAEAPSDQIPSLTRLIEARWQADPDPALFDAWAAEVDPGLALVAALLPEAGDARWHALLSHGTPGVAGEAAVMMMGGRPPLPLLGARALLTRPDVRHLCADGPRSPVRRAVEACMGVIADAGDASDLRLLGEWRGAASGGERARRSHQALKARLGDDVRGAGGLALAVDEQVSGGLSPADGGGLSPAEPRRAESMPPGPAPAPEGG